VVDPVYEIIGRETVCGSEAVLVFLPKQKGIFGAVSIDYSLIVVCPEKEAYGFFLYSSVFDDAFVLYTENKGAAAFDFMANDLNKHLIKYSDTFVRDDDFMFQWLKVNDFFRGTTAVTQCTCDFYVMANRGCQCGAINKERNRCT
jgi:hypothetical protein